MTADINKQEAVIPQLLSKLFLIINIIETNKSARFIMSNFLVFIIFFHKL